MTDKTPIRKHADLALGTLEEAVGKREIELAQRSIEMYDGLGVLIRRACGEDYMRWLPSYKKAEPYDLDITEQIIGKAASLELANRVSRDVHHNGYGTGRNFKRQLYTALADIYSAYSYKRIENIAHSLGRNGDFAVIMRAMQIIRR